MKMRGSASFAREHNLPLHSVLAAAPAAVSPAILPIAMISAGEATRMGAAAAAAAAAVVPDLSAATAVLLLSTLNATVRHTGKTSQLVVQ